MIGKLRERVTLKSRAATADSIGGPVVTFTDIATVWGRMTYLTQSEIFRQTKIGSDAKYKLRIRHRDDVTRIDRVTSRGIDYEVVGLSNMDERRRYLDLFLVEYESSQAYQQGTA